MLLGFVTSSRTWFSFSISSFASIRRSNFFSTSATLPVKSLIDSVVVVFPVDWNIILLKYLITIIPFYLLLITCSRSYCCTGCRNNFDFFWFWNNHINIIEINIIVTILPQILMLNTTTTTNRSTIVLIKSFWRSTSQFISICQGTLKNISR